jgi:hypothetical protein
MKLFDGLYSYEIILLCLGILFFLILVVMLIIYVVQKRSVKELTIYFLVAIIMIAYPSIQKISYDNGVLTFETKAKEVEQDPANSTKRNQLETALSKIENRPTQNSQRLVNYGKAYGLLGDTTKALSFANASLKKDIKNPGAADLKKRLTLKAIHR